MTIASDTRPSTAPRLATRKSRHSVRKFRSRTLDSLARSPSAIVGAGLFLLLLGLGLAASLLYPADPMASVAAPLLAPGQSAAFPLGSDSLGRDIAAQIVHGARTSLFVGGAATAIGLSLGIVLGGLGGYFGGWVDNVIVRITELFQTTPTFLFAVAIVAIDKPSAGKIALAVGLTSWPMVSRLVRAEVRRWLRSDFVLAARSAGFSDLRLMWSEILPNVLPAVIVIASAKFATAVLMESGLSFLGLGDPNQVSWGAMIEEGRDLVRTAWHVSALPGAALALCVLSLNLLGDGLNDALNPRHTGDAE
jgi:peptide/nickel transport system permease protein